jgi:two-component system, OmpR family, response regulator PrrA
MRILLVEDDARMRALVRRGLAEHGHVVEVAGTGPAALDAARASQFDVVVLDVMLPGCSGVDVARRLRESRNPAAVLMLTARDAVADIVAGLDAGADDYLVKPFAFKVLLARLRALGRRPPAVHTNRFQVADLVLDSEARVVTRGGTVIPLTRTEFNLLECLVRNTGRVATREMLVERVWGADRDVEANTLDAFVKSLRQKLDAGGRAKLIHTIRGIGYSIREEPES